jgi:hypothetical protein
MIDKLEILEEAVVAYCHIIYLQRLLKTTKTSDRGTFFRLRFELKTSRIQTYHYADSLGYLVMLLT